MEHNVSPSTTAFHDYLISIYWAAATMTTVGYGDVSAHTVPVSILSEMEGITSNITVVPPLPPALPYTFFPKFLSLKMAMLLLFNIQA